MPAEPNIFFGFSCGLDCPHYCYSFILQLSLKGSEGAAAFSEDSFFVDFEDEEGLATNDCEEGLGYVSMQSVISLLIQGRLHLRLNPQSN